MCLAYCRLGGYYRNSVFVSGLGLSCPLEAGILGHQLGFARHHFVECCRCAHHLLRQGMSFIGAGSRPAGERRNSVRILPMLSILRQAFGRKSSFQLPGQHNHEWVGFVPAVARMPPPSCTCAPTLFIFLALPPLGRRYWRRSGVWVASHLMSHPPARLPRSAVGAAREPMG